jgi:hypothetical protein
MMKSTSDAIHGWEPEPYDVPRGTCPECGSRAVKHLVIGYLEHPESMETTPAWVERVGCLHPEQPRVPALWSDVERLRGRGRRPVILVSDSR